MWSNVGSISARRRGSTQTVNDKTRIPLCFSSQSSPTNRSDKLKQQEDEEKVHQINDSCSIRSTNDRSHSSDENRPQNCINSNTTTKHKDIFLTPLTRYKHAICSTSSGLIYIYGGRFGNSALDDDVWQFDAHNNLWTQLETHGQRPPSLQEHTLVEYNNRLYLFGGQISASNSEGCFWTLDLMTNEWVKFNQTSSAKFGAHLTPKNRRAHSAIIYKDSMYIFGGFEDFRGSSANLWEFNFICETWHLRDLNATSAYRPEPRHAHSAIIHRDSMYIYGGLSNLKPLNDLWRWSWREKRWFKVKTKGKSPGYLHGHSAVQAFDSMFVFGGERNGRATRSLWRLNLINLVWQKVRAKGPLPNPTTWHAAIANPLSLLDQSNYIVEGCDSDEEEILFKEPNLIDQQRYEEHSNMNNGQIDYIDDENTRIKQKLSHSKSAAVEFVTTGISKAQVHPQKRQSKLHLSNLLRHRNRNTITTNVINRNTNEQKSMRTSISDTNIRPSNIFREFKSVITPKKETRLEIQSNSPDTSKTQNTEIQEQVGVLDSLDSEIKQMFQQVLDKTDKVEYDEVIQAQLEQIDEVMSVDEQYQICDGLQSTASSHYVSAGEGSSQIDKKHCQARLSQMTNYTTAPNNLDGSINFESLSQASSSQTLTKYIDTNTNIKSDFSLKANCDVDITSVRKTRRVRPKSEIVQSLIEQADARIKHLYMPLFQPSNGNHNNRKSEQQAHELNNTAANRHRLNARNRLSFNEVNQKRHTIHQTMTYYNLYFSEEKYSPPSDQSSNEATSSKNMTSFKNANYKGRDGVMMDLDEDESQSSGMTRDELSSTTIRDLGHQSRRTRDQLDTITTGNLVGVRTNSSSSRDASSASSRTLVDYNNKGRSRFDGDKDNISRKLNDTSPKSADLSLRDDTSLSLSGMVEFEEDDMLQLQFETNQKSHQTQSPDVDSRLSNLDESPNNQVDSDDHDSDQYNISHQNQNGQVHIDKTNFDMQKHSQKSTSSGYESMSGVGWNEQSPGSSARSNYQQLSAIEPSISTQQDSRIINMANGSQDSSLRTEENNGNLSTTNSLDFTSDNGIQTPLTPTIVLSKKPTSTSVDSKEGKQEKQQQLISNSNLKLAAVQSAVPGESSNETPGFKTRRRSKLFSNKRKTKRRRFWQLCMFVIGGKESGYPQFLQEPISIWRLYI